jgi:hypothetical protein
MATELQDLVEEFISKLRLLWERTEADLSRERTKHITIYIGKSC